MVLLDLMMPQVDGEAVLRSIRSDEALRGLPVVVYSAISDPAVVLRLEASGATDHVVKGTDWQALYQGLLPYAQ